MPTIIASQMEDIADLCRRFDIAALYLFGSAAQGRFDPARSDLDFQVDLGEYGVDVLERFAGFESALGELLHRDVDLITVNSRASAGFLQHVNATRQLIYAA